MLNKTILAIMLDLVSEIKADTATLEHYKQLINLLVENNVTIQEELDSTLNKNGYKNIDEFYDRNNVPFARYKDEHTISIINGTLSGTVFKLIKDYLNKTTT